MSKFKIFNLILSVLFIVEAFLMFGIAKAETNITNLPDNVKITSTPNGSSIFITSKPGYKTSVSTSCENGKCSNSATNTVITNDDVKKIEDNIKSEQLAFQKMWEQQMAFFKAQQEYFNSFWKAFPF